MSPRRRLAVLILILALLPLAGCSTLANNVRTYRLAYTPPAPASPPVPATVRVIPFGIATVYDRLGFIYREGPYDIGVDSYHQWIADPAGMITDLIARDLSAADAFLAVLQAPSALPTNYELSGWVETFEERDSPSCTAHVRLRALFVRVPERGTRQVLLEESLTGDEPCHAGDADSFAEAMSRAVQRLSDDIRARTVAAALAPPS